MSIFSLFKRDRSQADATAVVGIDVGSTSVKVVQLHMKKEVPVLDTYGELQLGPYDNLDVGRAARLRSDRLTEALVDILREAGVKATQTALAISYNATFTSVITLAISPTLKAEDVLSVEARKYIPVPLTDVTLDWVPIGVNEKNTEERGLLVATHNEALSRYDAILKGAKLPLLLQEVELFSTIRTVLSEKDETVCIIDLGGGSTKVYIVHKGMLVKSHSLQFSGAELTDLISKTLAIDFKTAEEEKRTYGLSLCDKHPELQKSITTAFDRSMREVQAVLRQFEAEEGKKIEKVILTGGAALLSGTPERIADTLTFPVELARPFSKVSYPAFLTDTLLEAGPSFAVAIGVALRGVFEGND